MLPWRLNPCERNQPLKRSKSIAAGVVVLLAFVLSSCISLDADISLNGDALATGTMKIEMSKQIALLGGITSKEAFEEQIASSNGVALPEGQSVTVSENDTSYIMSVKLENSPLTDDGLKAEKLADGTVKFTFKNEGTDSSLSGLGDDTGKIELTVKFPGSVTDSSPEFVQVDDQTLKLEASFGDPLDVYAVSTVDESGSSSTPVVPIVLGLVILSAIAIGLVRQRKAKSPLPPPHADESSPII